MAKQFFFKTILSIFFTAIIGIIFSIFVVIKIFPIQKNTYSLAHIDKIELLKEKQSKPKIVLFGGSNVAFGFDCDLLKQKFYNYDVINIGTDASLGMRFPLDEIKNSLNPNDILLVFPEFNHYMNGGYGGSSLWQLLSYKKSLSNLDFNLLLKILPSIKSIFNLQINAFASNKLFKKIFTYDRRNFNHNGDYIGHHNFPLSSTIEPSKMIISYLDNSFYNYLDEYKINLENNNIKVLYFPPVYQKSSGELSRKEIEKIYSKSKNLFSSKYDKYFLEDYLFYDTVYHLNKEGANLRTNILIEDLTEILNTL
ncbi:MAG: hypothetical protein RR358_03375 [Cetobacterium sp.]